MDLLMIGRDPSVFSDRGVGDLSKRLTHYSEHLTSIFFLTTVGTGLSPKAVSRGNVSIVGVPGNPLLFFIFGIWYGAKFLLRTKTRIITCQDPFLTGTIGYFLKLFCGPITRRNLKLVIDVHSDMLENKYWAGERFSNVFLNHIGKFLVMRAEAVRVVSSYLLEKLNSLGVPQPKLFFLPVGTDIASLSHNSRKTGKKGTKDLLFVGRMVEQKNLPTLIKAFSIFSKMHPRSTLTLVGEGPDKNKLEKLASSLGLEGKARFLGRVDEKKLQDLYNASDALVLPSFHEGWGLVVIEAFSMGLPVVVSKAVAQVNPNIVDGKTAVVFEGGPKQLSDALEQFFSFSTEKRKKMAQIGREKSLEFDIRKVARRRAEFFKRLLAT
ncbi:glycosyltransferase [Candidatus Micrarchaeota archaeon]|nr:glycosyltransferase [Candidatus Micrarchaeota archaeon]